jgi:CheY-like chemotaxis protein
MPTDVQADLSGLRVLLVDDELESLEAFGEMFRVMGATVTLASSAAEALESSERSDFDVILSDVAMPGGDGLALLKTLRDLPHTRRTMCIAVTGESAPDVRERVLEAGFDAYLGKPVDVSRLVELIATNVKRA